jgi:hypothetical protein
MRQSDSALAGLGISSRNAGTALVRSPRTVLPTMMHILAAIDSASAGECLGLAGARAVAPPPAGSSISSSCDHTGAPLHLLGAGLAAPRSVPRSPRPRSHLRSRALLGPRASAPVRAPRRCRLRSPPHRHLGQGITTRGSRPAQPRARPRHQWPPTPPTWSAVRSCIVCATRRLPIPAPRAMLGVHPAVMT